MPDPDKAPEGDRFSSQRLVDDLRDRGIDAAFFPHAGAILEDLTANRLEGDVVVILSNGDFEGLVTKLLSAL